MRPVHLNSEYKGNYDEQNEKYCHIVGSRSPVFNGFSILSEFWSFNDLIDIVTDWRENMWIDEDRNKPKSPNITPTIELI